ncbi:Ldh family oxidoreductase [Candidatus Bathyarchaeota archaeon]|nr:Ldh family oxidoreductase [Candidatus Bathyarchaeota archaeon]
MRRVSSDIFLALGAPKEGANLVADLLVRANLAGVDSHGIIRIPSYVKEIEEHRIVPGSKPKVVKDMATITILDGNRGFGQVVALKAMELAIEKAGRKGLAATGAYNCGHIGRLADYAILAAERNMIGLVMTPGGRWVAPWGGMEAILGISPISIAIPAGKYKPFVLDMSSGVAAAGKIRVKAVRGEKLPLGWIIDKDGKPSTNPEDLEKGGAILPIGGDVGYKGHGLSLIVEFMCGPLLGFKELTKGPGKGIFMMALNIEDFTPIEEFKTGVDSYIETVKASRLAQGYREILIPGEPEFREDERRRREGIYVEEATWDEIVKIARRLKVEIE